MTYFSDFQPEELSLILSVPYRAGAYVAHADDVEGCERDDIKEMAALEKVLIHLRDKAGKGSFSGALLDEILGHKEDWASWGHDLSSVTGDVSRAVRLVLQRLPEKELKLYRWCVFQTAKTVAMAANEADTRADNLSPAMGGDLMMAVRRWLYARNIEALPENISPAEKDALQKLQAALKG